MSLERYHGKSMSVMMMYWLWCSSLKMLLLVYIPFLLKAGAFLLLDNPGSLTGNVPMTHHVPHALPSAWYTDHRQQPLSDEGGQESTIDSRIRKEPHDWEKIRIAQIRSRSSNHGLRLSNSAGQAIGSLVKGKILCGIVISFDPNQDWVLGSMNNI